MAYKVIVTNDVLPGQWYEVGLLTKEDAKNRNIRFKTDKVLSNNDIKLKLETITNCYVEAIKRVTKYRREKEKVPDEFGVSITGEYTMLGESIMSDTLFLPLVKKQYVDSGTLELELKEFFGNDFQVHDYSPR